MTQGKPDTIVERLDCTHQVIRSIHGFEREAKDIADALAHIEAQDAEIARLKDELFRAEYPETARVRDSEMQRPEPLV